MKRYPWAEIVADLRAQPNKWILDRRMVGRPVSAAMTVKTRRLPVLQLDDGRISTHLANRRKTDEGQELADLWLRFIPKEEA